MNKLADAQKNGLLTSEYWQKRLLGIIAIEKEQMVFQNLGVEKTIPKNQGTKNFSIRRYLQLPVDLTKQLLTEGVAPESLKIEGTKVTGTVNQYGALIKLTDVTDDIHFDDIKREYQPELARHAVEVRERDVMKSFSEASEVFIGGHSAKTALTDADVLTLRALRKTATTMRVNKRKGHRKASGSPLVVTSPQGMQDLLDDKDLLNNALHGIENGPIKNGSLRAYKIYDLVVQETLILEPEVVSDFNVYTTYVLGHEPYAVLKLGNLSWHDVPFKATVGNELAQTASVGYKMWTGAKVIDPLAIYAVYHRSKDFDIVADKNDPYGKPASQV